MEVSRHDGEDFEKANLLLAKFYIDKVTIMYELWYVLYSVLCRIFSEDFAFITSTVLSKCTMYTVPLRSGRLHNRVCFPQ